jgi:hypothetical protein
VRHASRDDSAKLKVFFGHISQLLLQLDHVSARR